jgi:beta-xylosidase
MSDASHPHPPSAFSAGRKVKRLNQLVARVVGRRPASAPAEAPAERRNRHLWSIGIYEGASPLALGPSTGVRNPVMTREQVTDVRAGFVADPFLVRDGETTYLFFEVVNLERKRGEIAVASSRDLVGWAYHQIVLREPFHLSYPQVLHVDGEYYMIPETHETRTIRLYRASRFPTEWELVDTLLTGKNFSDATLLRRDGRWWMFVDTSDTLTHDTLRLYHAEDLRGAWTEHPASPIVEDDPHSARPGGRLVEHEGRLYRFAQDCRPSYGLRVQPFEITALTPTTYAERPVGGESMLEGSGAGWNAAGMHHVDAHRIDGRWIAAVDGWHWATRSEQERTGSHR